MPITTCIFDAYGTLFDVAAAARELARTEAALADTWPRLAADWRTRQLSYTWLRATADQHLDFWRVTGDALDWALEAQSLPEALRAPLMNLYWTLGAYPEVPQMLTDLKARGLATGILSNGTPEMLDGAVDHAGIGNYLDAVLSVETIGIFKPHPRVYDLVGQQFGCAPDQVLFVSSNGWDAAAASAYGFTTLWVNRAGEPRERLWGAPDHEARDLTQVGALI